MEHGCACGNRMTWSLGGFKTAGSSQLFSIWILPSILQMRCRRRGLEEVGHTDSGRDAQAWN